MSEDCLFSAADDGCKTERNNHLDTACKHLLRMKRGANARNTRQVFSDDIENPRHVVDRSESDKTGFRSPKRGQQTQGTEAYYNRHTTQNAETSDNFYSQFRSPRLDQRLWPGGEVLYTIDPAISKITAIKSMHVQYSSCSLFRIFHFGGNFEAKNVAENEKIEKVNDAAR